MGGIQYELQDGEGAEISMSRASAPTVGVCGRVRACAGVCGRVRVDVWNWVEVGGVRGSA